MSVGTSSSLVEKAKEAGAAVLPEKADVEPGPLLRKLLSGVSESGTGCGTMGLKPVHLVKNVQPLPKKVVDAIQEGMFVEFAGFPVLEEGPVEGDWKEGHGDGGDGSGALAARKKKERKEIPDISWWSTCFSLFQAAWAAKKPEMWLPLTAYRETIFRLARRHPWVQVVKYDRRFRQEASGREDTKWEKEKVSLVMEIMAAAAQSKSEAKSSGSGTPKRGDLRRRGACFRYNKEGGNCAFGTQCKFGHVCSRCGGDHPMFKCKVEEKGTRGAG